MVRSMTGYGRFELLKDDVNYTVEIKSVNHRYFEFSVRTPKGCAFLDEKLKSFFAKRITRGKIEVYVGIEGGARSSSVVSVNEAVAESYVEALKSLKKKYGLSGKVSLSDVITNNDIFVVTRPKMNEEEIWNSVEEAANGAIDAFVKMREIEGERLAQDVKSRCEYILSMVGEVEKNAPETLKNYRERLEKKLREVLEDTSIDEQRILTEAAIFADKIATDEETVRLRSHINQLISMIDSDETLGKKFDFVVQEMNREANTIGSKAQNVEITRIVVEIKGEIEKIREQIQNIE